MTAQNLLITQHFGTSRFLMKWFDFQGILHSRELIVQGLWLVAVVKHTVDVGSRLVYLAKTERDVVPATRLFRQLFSLCLVLIKYINICLI